MDWSNRNLVALSSSKGQLVSFSLKKFLFADNLASSKYFNSNIDGAKVYSAIPKMGKIFAY